MTDQLLSPVEALTAIVAAVGGPPLIGKAIAYLLHRRDAAHIVRRRELDGREAALDQREQEQTQRLEASTADLEEQETRQQAELASLRRLVDRYMIGFQVLAAELARLDATSPALTQVKAIMDAPAEHPG